MPLRGGMSVLRGWRLGALLLLAALLVLVAASRPWWQGEGSDPGPGFVSGNGRIEATEIDIATRLPGRVADVLVDEGDTVEAGQVLARMDPHTLLAQRAESAARVRQARDAVAQAEAGLAMRRADAAAAGASVVQRLSELDAAQRRLRRSTTLAAAGAAPSQELDDDQARVRGAEAAVAAARAQREAAAAAVEAARAQVIEARSSVDVALAAAAGIEADLRELDLTAPRAGRVQYRVAEPGEVLPGGGTVLNLIDLGDVFMNFFVPETAAGRVALGAEVRLRLDAAPGFIVPARVTYVASSAQFTPKSVETASERQKLMFRVKAQVDRQVLLRYADYVKAGVPGVAWVRLDARVPWPPTLALRSGR